MANLRTNNLSGEQGQNAFRGSVFFDGGSFLSFDAAIWNSTASDSCTFECWLWVSDLNAARNIFDLGSTGDFSIQTDGQIRVHPVSSNWMDTNNSITTKSWHHIALVQESGRKDVYINGVKSSQTVGGGNPVSSNWANTNANTFNLGDDGTYRDFFRGYMSNVRVIKGVALYDDDFTPPFTELKATDSNTSLLCCQNSNDVTQEETGKTITGNGSLATAGYNKTQPKVIPPYGVDAGNVFGGPIQQSSQGYMYFPTGRTEERGRGRAVFMGGSIHPVSPSYTANIDYVEMTTSGVGVRFGSLSTVNTASAAFASSTRGINAGGQPSSPDGQTNILEFVTIATEGNGTDFGDLDTAHRRLGGQGHSSQTRGIIAGGGGDSPAQTNVIQFVTIASIGNATNFGDLLNPKDTSMAKNGSSTRMLICGGRDYTPSAANTNVIEFITIATTGNSQNFGDLTSARSGGTGCSSATRGVIVGGRTPTVLNTIDFVTIASAGDATDFGDLTAVNAFLGGANNSIKGIFAGGSTPTKLSTIQSIEIATTGDAVAFGDNNVTDPVTGRGTCSDSHGGLS